MAKAKIIVGLFNDHTKAQQVIQALVNDGFPREDVSVVTSDSNAEHTTTSGSAVASDTAASVGTGAVVGGLAGLLLGLATLAIPGIGPIIAAGPIAAALTGAGIGAVTGGLIGALTSQGVPEHEAQYYAEGIRRGGTLVMVKAPDDRAERAATIMSQFGAEDIERRAVEWQQSGWTKPQPKTQPKATPPPRTVEASQPPAPRAGTTAKDEIKVPVVQEDLQVGKQPVTRGGVRIYSHTTDVPVEKNVPLREEHVSVERRPVDRPAGEADLVAFEEAVIEVTEIVEEPVVTKRPRVTEEVVVKKDVNERSETVRDSVRRTEVNVEPRQGNVQSRPGSFESYNEDFRKNFETTYAGRGHKFEQYGPAYQYGYTLGTDPRNRDRDWAALEPQARRDWEGRKAGAWDEFKEAIRYAWDRVRGRRAA